MNAKMPELVKAFQLAGFTEVKTVRSSGNVVFSARTATESSLERRAETAMEQHLGHNFLTIVRSVDVLREILESDPYARFRLKPGSKRIITFLRGKPKTDVKFPVGLGDARILCRHNGEIFSVYIPDPQGPDFMTLIEKTYGKDVTTRTWETVEKIAR